MEVQQDQRKFLCLMLPKCGTKHLTLEKKNIDNSQKGNPRALQVTTLLRLAIQLKIIIEIC
jgi:hypothetical protein